jgi:diguanylate cyclase (GGDEF)-like protein/PAS domain S-box-containing protein
MIAVHEDGPGWTRSELVMANAAIVGVYLCTSWLIGFLELPSAYATPVFPPAGVDFALVAAAGGRCLPGVALGVLGFQWLAGVPPGAGAPVTAVAMAAVAFGYCLQAWLGTRWFRRLIQPALADMRDIVRFLLLAPVACLISASVGVSALSLLGLVSAGSRLPLWTIWWIGDTVGVLLAAPLTWLVCGRPRMLWRRRAPLVALPLLLAAGAVLVAYGQAAQWERQRHLASYRLKAQEVADLTQAELRDHERFANAFAATRVPSDRYMPREQFWRIAIGWANMRPEIANFNWMVPLSAAQRPGFEAWVRRNVDPGFPGLRELVGDYDLRPSRQQADYLALLYTWPPAYNFMRGLDFLHAPKRGEPARRALQGGGLVATPPIELVSRRATGMVLFRAAGLPDEPAFGVIGIAVDARRLLDQSMELAHATGFETDMADVTLPGKAMHLAGDTRRAATADDHSATIAYGGRIYLLRFHPTAAYLAHLYGPASWIVLTTGLLLTALLGALMLLVSGERARFEALVTERTARLQAILDNAADAIVTVGADGTVLAANTATATLFGYPPEHLPGLVITSLMPAHADESAPQWLERLAHASVGERELAGMSAHGEPLPMSVSVAAVQLPTERLYVCILRDLTEQYRSQADIYRLAHSDPLTGLENRHALGLRLEQQLAQARRSEQTLAVLFIDLDHFKKINDSLGHQAGDALLVAASARMKDLLRDVDTLARLGGDEFIIVLGGPLTPDAVSAVAVRLVESLRQPYALAGATAHSGASVGVALFPDDGIDPETLMRHADVAMYAAKREGRGNFQFYSPAMNALTHEHLMLENRMWMAIEHDGFQLYLQAQVDLDSGRVIGAEVLLRWHDPQLGDITPSRFIPIAEDSGMILPLGDWVLDRTMALLSEWQREGLDGLRLAVNLSARQFSGGALLDRLDQLLVQHPIDPSRLELEITETAAMRDPENTRRLLFQLRERGFKLAIDDFGTGYSSLAYLKLFAIDRIKIDRGFVKDIETDPNDAAIVGATIGLAHSLGLSVVAEGVETHAQWRFLRDKHGDEAQGYLFGRPMPAGEFRETLRRQAQPAPGPSMP